MQHMGSLVVACEVCFPDQGLNPWRPALGAWSLRHWTTRKSPENCLYSTFQPVFLFSAVSQTPTFRYLFFRLFCCVFSLLVSYPHPCSHAYLWLILFYQASFTFPPTSFSKPYVCPSSGNVSFHDTYVFVF